MNRFWDWKKIAIAAALVCLALYPVVHGSQYIMHVTIMFFIWGVVASLWNLLAGYAGVLSLGNMAFLLIGGYTSGILSKTFGVSPWFAVLIAALATMIAVTIILALPALRLTGIYIALLTIVFSDALPSLLTQTRKFTGGAAGLKEIPPFWPGMERIHAYYVVFAVFLIILALIYRITRSNTGLAFQAMRDDEDLALSLGVNLYLEKIKVFAVTSFFTGLIGGVYVHYLGSISPATNSLESFMLAICMIFLGGGFARYPGAVIGAFFLTFTNEFLQLTGTLRPLLIGFIICVLILYLPDGFMQIVDWIDRQINRRKPDSAHQPGMILTSLIFKTFGSGKKG